MYTFLVNTHAKLRIGQKRGIRRSVRIIMYTILQHFLGRLKINYFGFMGSVTGCFFGNLVGNFFLSINRSSIRSINFGQRTLTKTIDWIFQDMSPSVNPNWNAFSEGWPKPHSVSPRFSQLGSYIWSHCSRI